LLRKAAEEKPLTDEIIREYASNGTGIIETIIKNKAYKSITGATIKIDKNGDSEGNFSVLALKPSDTASRENFTCDLAMIPVAHFQEGEDFPEYKFSVAIDWPGGMLPTDQPSCGFNNELCPKDDSHVTSMVVSGILGLVLFCALVITMSIYRKWKIELEIEGLLWKIDPHEIKGFFNNDIVSSPSKVIFRYFLMIPENFNHQIFYS
jgi:guanylate cyclase